MQEGIMSNLHLKFPFVKCPFGQTPGYNPPCVTDLFIFVPVVADDLSAERRGIPPSFFFLYWKNKVEGWPILL